MLTPGDHPRTLRAGGRDRSYLLHVPARLDGSRPTPVVLALHGATSNGRLMQQFCGLSEKADREGFLAVYPNGTGSLSNVLTWNGGAHYGYASRHGVDDVGFFGALLDDVALQAPVDLRRVYAAGMSNGAQMVYRLAAELADRITAVAAVAGPMALDECRPARPVPVLHIHGTDDDFAPFHGGRGARSVYGATFKSVDETIRCWVRANGCAETPVITEEQPLHDDGTRIIRHRYTPAGGGADVELIVVEGGGHTWPGRPPWPERLGKSTANLDANDVIWDFFSRHSLGSE